MQRQPVSSRRRISDSTRHAYWPALTRNRCWTATGRDLSARRRHQIAWSQSAVLWRAPNAGILFIATSRTRCETRFAPAPRRWLWNAKGPRMFAKATQAGTLTIIGHVALPPHQAGGFDHADVYLPSGRVFVAHTANDTVDVIDGEHLSLEETLSDCPEGSGVLCAHGAMGLVFAAARSGGSILVVDPGTLQVLRRVSVGPKPN